MIPMHLIAVRIRGRGRLQIAYRVKRGFAVGTIV
jgi:hypothetical protein